MPTTKRTINSDLEKERRKCTFDVEELARYWIGDQSKLEEKRAREDFFLNDPELQDETPPSYLSHKELYEYAIRKSTIVFRKIKQLQEEGKDGVDNYLALLGGLLGSGIIKDGNPFAVHFVMFVPTILGQGTLEQQGEWLGRAWNMEIVGTYAQTELGHGTFIRGLETRATYDEKTEEFVLHSPSLTAYKWWPGGLGHSSSYAVVVAQLYSKGQNHGIHPFIVQLRDEETWEPMPGIKIGEIGPKLGLKSVNNGYLGFDNVRIPRKNMLMKNAQVKRDGTFVKSPSSVLTYGTMMFVRVVILRDVSNYLSKAVTIATRYSAVRRQSPIDPNEAEPQVIDHVTQQYKVFPNIAKVFVIKLAADYIWDMYNQVTSELDRGDLERLPELHALACCLKSICTADGAAAIEQLRLACGGHGYMECSNLPSTYGMVTAACTYEGENTVLLLQTARYLIKNWDWALQGKSLVPTLSYLRKFVKTRNQQEWNSSITGIIEALQAVSANKLRLSYQHLEERKKNGLTNEHAANATSIELVQCAESHCRSFLVSSAYEMTKDINKKLSPELSIVIHQLVELYAIDTCLKSLADLLRFTTISESDIQNLSTKLEACLVQIRPNAVGIVDGFDIPDGILCSALGAYDGNVYERLFAEAQKSPLNRATDNKAFHLYLKPFLKSNL
ncbi:probable peroxisomal acyl-coenzyme A oxidase 1 [Sitodiplosis mosellana]|uniref:probable peroxisomal acyl-coenzyme A oxidase 1 n=1 Tax=Sitodiplosis mosellana TaxID=263140 RepID=UPI002443799E|nr:probable peroxisomal acyl-coenzyme A oxidase 1 [Sitodiplosis mosellana]XP_055310445.1 probable peroxisomal acyl-coenzyme A oxidase 1 [Sitodiplosis mosellana]XP_055310446.1 probable peroxisomal acyl-coenzyme A oxidase 1 [Sitodiplosis mosellana]XP_055310447.1 probable peroxisomal acyl-coenzyme A oxidase 1 [Sitodiplosis mosellana]XP_055310448.1 probable peroxisomal acyl-coenzyme A oxidase 1 [Sitodiplosis mosellana]XP_055310449.1 probable peroxisomal acyl-coenzyme A oxidase 1 [Sitodiplosis mose